MHEAPTHKPFVAAGTTMRELTVRALVMGSLLGIVFALSSVYLGLKVGLTVSASIPVAVLSITLFRWLRLNGTILENNIVQTTGSAGESIAAGVAFTLPSLLLMGYDMELVRVLLVALFGGLIGVLMMIPLRHGLIVKEHANLAYPEGTACADVLIVGEKGGSEATMVFTGFFIGLAYAFLNLIAKVWADTATFAMTFGGALKKATIGFEVTPPMLGVGYIIGPKVSANMLGGGLLAFMVLVPLIVQFGGESVAAMSPGQIRGNYILYIGAGAVATGGFIALARSIPTIASAFRRGLGNLSTEGNAEREALPRTEQDLSMKIVLGGVVAIGLAILVAPVLGLDALTAMLVILFGFFFVTVSSRITGEIGSSSNPISGMTIATLLLTCGLFVALGWTGVDYKALALTTAALVCVAASNGGTISQDLKTGYLVGATPKFQQIAILVGVITSAIVIGFTLQLLDESRTTFEPVQLPGITVGHLSDKSETGPDGKSYRIGYVRDSGVAATDGTAVPRGRYLVDEQGAPTFLVDSSVSPRYPWKLDRASGHVASVEGTPMELGIDRQLYHLVVVTSEADGLRPGHYLADDAGNVVYRKRPAEKFDAPKAQLFALIIDGTLGGSLPWGLVLIGVFLAIILELVGVSSLPFAVGLYLPISTSGGIFVGGAVRWLIDRRRKGESAASAEFSPGMLMASGLIAGGAIAGVLQSVILTAGVDRSLDLSDNLPVWLVGNTEWWPMVPFMAMAAGLLWVGVQRKK